jgi:tetrahydromethanopterin S-methyltransferase subunit G
MKMVKPDITNNGLEVKIAVIQNDVDYLRTRVDEISDKLDDKFVTQVEFDPIRKLVYGIVGLILVTVVGAILSVVINRGG